MSEWNHDKFLRERLCNNLQAFRVVELDSEDRIRAAVAFTLVDCSHPADIGNLEHDITRRDQAAFVLTTRTPKLKHHASQRAFPGGRIDTGETVVQAALRELDEEVGLKLNPGHVLGRLDDYATRSGFVISPVVVWAEQGTDMQANADEVETIHRIPIQELVRDDAPVLEAIPESEHPVLMMPLGDDWFAAPSAAIAYQFREVAMFGRDTRVSHFEQPYFAWK